MTFLNPILLFGLAAVAVPVLLHLLHRRRAQVVDWGAMRFLLASLAHRNRRIRLEELLLLLARCLLIALVVLAMARPFVVEQRLVGHTDQPQDIAIVLDGSLSMTLDNAGATNFQRAIGEAKSVIAACRPGDAVSVILAGSTARPVVARPTSDHQAVLAALDQLAPTRGSMRAVDALNAASRSLAGGNNPAKRIVLITDGQATGWDLSAQARWEFLARDLERLPTRPVVLVRALELPRTFRNLATSRIRLGRKVIGTDRAVTLAADVVNTGSAPLTPDRVVFSVGGRELPPIRVDEAIAPGAAHAVEIDHVFAAPGPHVVRVRVSGPDDLPGDDERAEVVFVRRTLEVLVIDGDPSTRPLEGESAFAEIALTRSERGPEAALIRTRVVAAPDAASVGSLEPYDVVLLADVPRLPEVLAAAVADRVARGAGLLVAPGDRVQQAFYAQWRTEAGQSVLPAELVEQVDDTGDGGQAARVSPSSVSLAPLRPLASPEAYDLRELLVRRHWRLAVPAGLSGAVGAALESGDPLLVEQPLGRGRVVLLGIPLDDAWTNLPSRRAFVPLVHELTYHLTAPVEQGANLQAGEPFVYLTVARAEEPTAARVVDPAGREAPPLLRHEGDRWQIHAPATDVPGVYVLRLGDGLSGATAPAEGTLPEVPFVVLGEPDESRLEPLGEDQLEQVRRYADVRSAVSRDQLIAAIRGQTPGMEIWWALLLAALGVLVLEVALTRWVARRRKLDRPETVDFGAGRADLEALRRRLEVEPAEPQAR